uniref:HP domain-containing protein n=1 Tax=Parascaris equorum TaxID=6256 RepID=A0A914RS67_PAREQ
MVPQRWDPCDLDELLRNRTQYWPLEKVVARNLPSGVDLKRLEQYLDDKDFETVFEMDRQAFYSLPHWKQIELRKKHQLERNIAAMSDYRYGARIVLDSLFVSNVPSMFHKVSHCFRSIVVDVVGAQHHQH